MARAEFTTGADNITTLSEEIVYVDHKNPEPTIVDLSIQAVGAVEKVEDALVKLFLLQEPTQGIRDIPKDVILNPLDEIKVNLQSVIEISERVADIIQRELVSKLG